MIRIIPCVMVWLSLVGAVVADDLARLQGKWNVIEARKGPRSDKVNPRDLAGHYFEFQGDTLWIVSGSVGKDLPLKITLDPGANPKHLDYTVKSGQKVMGIYKIEGDTLFYIHNPTGRGRPKTFEQSKFEHFDLLTVLTRAKSKP